MKVYIDIFFFVNFLMNLQVFQILNYWRRKPAVSARSIAGAGLGGAAWCAGCDTWDSYQMDSLDFGLCCRNVNPDSFCLWQDEFPGTSSVCGRILSDRGCRFRNVIWNS